MARRSFKIDNGINGKNIEKVAIDPHYELKHTDSISDSLILMLVALLNGGDFAPETTSDRYEYYVTDGLILNDKKYKLIWLLEEDQLYVGVVNAYRRKLWAFQVKKN